MYSECYNNEIRNILRELNLMENSIYHLEYIINYINRRRPTYIKGIYRAGSLLKELKDEIEKERENIKVLQRHLQKDGLRDRIPEYIVCIKRKVSHLEKLVNIIERYIIQKGECITVIQNWPSIYTLSSVTSPEIVYEVYEEFAKLVLRLLGFNDLEEKPPIIVFGATRSGGTNAETYPNYRIIVMPRQARYDIRYLTYILHEAIHIATRYKGDNHHLWTRIHELSNEFIKIVYRYIDINQNKFVEEIDDEILVELIKFAIINKIINDFANSSSQSLIEIHEKIDFFLNNILPVCEILGLSDTSKCRSFIVETLKIINDKFNLIFKNDNPEDLNKMLGILYLLTNIEEKLLMKRNISFFPSSFIYAHKILTDGPLNSKSTLRSSELKKQMDIISEMNEYLNRPHYIMALVKFPTDKAWKNNINNYLTDVINFLNNRLQNTRLLGIFAVTGWFDYLMIIETYNVIDVIRVMDMMLANGRLEDGTVIIGRSLDIEKYDNKAKEVCGFAFLLIDIIHNKSQEHYDKLVNQIKEELISILNRMKNNIDFVTLTTTNGNQVLGLFHVFGKYDLAVLLKVKTSMSSLIELISRLKSNLVEKGIFIETQTIPCCILKSSSYGEY